MHWEEFKQQAPQLAVKGEDRFDRTGLVLLGSLRRNGFPRISPVEPLIANGKLYLGMMWQSRKALDLIRDSRCTINSIVANKEASEGEFKLFGRALEVNDLEERGRYGEALLERLGISAEALDEYRAARELVDHDHCSGVQDIREEVVYRIRMSKPLSLAS